MSTKKNIDQLFKERFENFEATPSPKVWANIQSQLKEQKEDRKVIPLWWKIAGVAALLALLFTIGNSIFKASEGDSIVTEDVDKIEQPNTTEKSEEIISNDSENSVIASEDVDTNNEETTSENNKKILQKTNTTPYKITNKQSNTTVIASEIVSDKNKGTQNKNASENKFIDPSTAIKNERIGIVTTSESTSEKKAVEENTTNPLIETNKKIETTGTAVTTSTQEKKTVEETSPNTTESATDTKKSIFEAIEETETAVAKTNTKKQLDNRWEVAPNFAPVYYNSLSEGSSIDPSFSDNSQSGDVNFSYGVKVSYNINERLSIRSGVSNVDLSYATGGVDLATGPVSQALRSINYGGSAVVVTAVDAGTIPENTSGNPFNNLTPKSASGEVQLIQNISYYEVPVELKYALLNNKFGVSILGGFSSLFLGNNEVSVQADNFSETLGEANNLSPVSFTTNVGLGLDYKISNKFTFNVEPMFKYQLNPYTDSSVNFTPYYVGLYTGFSYKF